MGFVVSTETAERLMAALAARYRIFAPKRFANGGAYSDTDCVRYGEITRAKEIVFDEKAQYSFKEALLPAVQTLFFFTEHTVKEADAPKKDALIFLRSCDLHALKRLDDMYLHNGPADAYYRRLREGARFVLMGCAASYENCFCVSMGTNRAETYDMSFDSAENGYLVDCKAADFEQLLRALGAQEAAVSPAFVTENAVAVTVPENLSIDVAKSKLWDAYDSRCIDCGRCNFVCPTCTCFTMQDMFYTENGRVGERRRVWASCMVNGFTDVAGGGSYRQKNGQRMRFKVLHKVYDYKARNGYHMCVGCGRCDDVCPEYISFSNCIQKLPEAIEEVRR